MGKPKRTPDVQIEFWFSVIYNQAIGGYLIKEAVLFPQAKKMHLRDILSFPGGRCEVKEEKWHEPCMTEAYMKTLGFVQGYFKEKP